MSKTRKGLNVVNTNEILLAQLYETIILKKEKGVIWLNSGGYKTNHTKNCINDLLPSGYKVYQENFMWFVKTPGMTLDFSDNMSFLI